jgi:plastocyanin
MQSKRPTILLAALVFGAVGLGACGSDDSGGDGGTDADITIKNLQFSIPATLAPGEITIANEDGATHTFTEGERGNAAPAFDVELAGAGATQTIDVEAGTYTVHCRIHASMNGTLVVS